MNLSSRMPKPRKLEVVNIEHPGSFGWVPGFENIARRSRNWDWVILHLRETHLRLGNEGKVSKRTKKGYFMQPFDILEVGEIGIGTDLNKAFAICDLPPMRILTRQSTTPFYEGQVPLGFPKNSEHHGLPKMHKGENVFQMVSLIEFESNEHDEMLEIDLPTPENVTEELLTPSRIVSKRVESAKIERPLVGNLAFGILCVLVLLSIWGLPGLSKKHGFWGEIGDTFSSIFTAIRYLCLIAGIHIIVELIQGKKPF